MVRAMASPAARMLTTRRLVGLSGVSGWERSWASPCLLPVGRLRYVVHRLDGGVCAQ